MKPLMGLLFVLLLCPAIAAAQDVCSPSKVTNLSGDVAKTTVALSWTNTGDDCNTGTATSYEIRYSTQSLDDTNWQQGTPVTGSVSGSSQCRGIADLTCNTTYYFVIFIKDEAGNRSHISNVLQRTTASCTSDLEVDC